MTADENQIHKNIANASSLTCVMIFESKKFTFSGQFANRKNRKNRLEKRIKAVFAVLFCIMHLIQIKTRKNSEIER